MHLDMLCMEVWTLTAMAIQVRHMTINYCTNHAVAVDCF